MLNKLVIFFQVCVATSTAIPVIVSGPTNFEKIVMDVDAGADDALAISMVLKNEEFFNGPPLIAITCVHGNTNLKNVKNNVMRTLQQLKREDIPVYIGANESFFGDVMQDEFFGKDGFGDVHFDPSRLVRPRNEHAVTALVRLVISNPGQITLLALGPLTNIALAVKLSPTFIRKLKNLYILGGSVSGIGNIRPGIEFNFYSDPEAVKIVLKKSTFDKVTLFPWDTTVNSRIPKEWRTKVLGNVGGPDIEFHNKIEAISWEKSEFWFYADSMATATYIWPSTVAYDKPFRVTSVACGESRGGLLVDFFFAEENVTTSNLNIILDFNVDEYKRLLYKYFSLTSSNRPPFNR